MTWIEALVPAAGLSSRMQQTNKLLLPLGQYTIIEHTINNLLSSSVNGVTVIAGSHRDKIIKVLGRYPVKILDNPNYKEGMSTSIKAGVHFLKYLPEVTATLVLPADMPFTRPGTVKSILDTYKQKHPLIIAPFYLEKRGHPVLFDSYLFPELVNISGDRGARGVIQKYEQELHKIQVKDPGVLTDIDSREEYRAAKKYFQDTPRDQQCRKNI